VSGHNNGLSFLCKEVCDMAQLTASIRHYCFMFIQGILSTMYIPFLTKFHLNWSQGLFG